ncbi:hypothetical protein OC834_007281 [Tilletia horrida]|uniref:26S proteasome complex subunit SEM1 n=1 Tax=Tilletia horrida TaxID=155126 RepID=A0AAN6JJ45_9BASI|nr:hypothetical protein OC834_007281 [Tilletia horrida]KAK0520029.1 hypothetical protein OC835_007340 [Tilletia horrida]KAK0527390.1 hypothetical protein OC842_004893 [Tilletia horrida]KAK0544782.1 hypothetical protein OC844_007430 [Tilletia horrida]
MSDGKKAASGSSGAAQASSSSTSQPQQAQQQDAAGLPGYGPLDEDDEFDDFPVQDWPDSDTVLHATKPAAASAAAAGSGSGAGGAGLKMAGGQSSTGDHLWEDNWDDDDVEDEFSKALRAEVEKQMGTQQQAMAT